MEYAVTAIYLERYTPRHARVADIGVGVGHYAELLARPNLKPEAVQRRTQIIISQARRLERIINDLHDASRLSTRQFTLDRSTCDVAALAREVVEQLSPVAPYHKFLV